MSKQPSFAQGLVFCGIDVSAKTLAVSVLQQDQPLRQRELANTAGGHKALIAWLRKAKATVRVSLEATGVYSLDLALALDAAEGIELSVLNPRRVHQFAQTLRRSKTDAADALVLAEYSKRMPFVAWRRPSQRALELRAVSRHLATLTEERARLHNRLHAAESSLATPRCVREDLKRSLAGIDKRILRLRKAAVALIERDGEMQRKFRHLTGITGIAETSAVHLLGELATLAPEMTARQWVAHSGLDPAHRHSGTSVNLPSRMSRHGNSQLRRALFMPALAGARFDPHMRAFYTLLQQRRKSKMQALMAVARKLLHAIYGIFKTNTPYEGSKLFPQLKVA
jgi:transposase